MSPPIHSPPSSLRIDRPTFSGDNHADDHGDVTASTGDTSRARIALYSHDTMGLGHLRRNILIASVLSSSPIGADVLVVSGAREACYFSMLEGVDCVTLPALRKDSEGTYGSRYLRSSYDRTTALRSRIIAATMEEFAPHVFVVDKVPRGIGNELDDTLEMLRAGNTTRCVLGLREILDDPATVMRQWVACDAERTIERHYDEVWIYGDRSVYDTVHQYSFGSTTTDRSTYTGYLDQRRRATTAASQRVEMDPNRKCVVCVVGGGQDGTSLASAFASMTLPSGWNGVLITGPFMSRPDREWLRQAVAARDEMTLIEKLVEADHYIARADRVISMAGYNTVSSILSFDKPALVVPRVHPRREQWIRAQVLAERNSLTMLAPDQLSAESLCQWIQQSDVPRPSRSSIDLGGLDRITQRVTNLLPATCSSSFNRSEVSIV